MSSLKNLFKMVNSDFETPWITLKSFNSCSPNKDVYEDDLRINYFPTHCVFFLMGLQDQLLGHVTEYSSVFLTKGSFFYIPGSLM